MKLSPSTIAANLSAAAAAEAEAAQANSNTPTMTLQSSNSNQTTNNNMQTLSTLNQTNSAQIMNASSAATIPPSSSSSHHPNSSSSSGVTNQVNPQLNHQQLQQQQQQQQQQSNSLSKCTPKDSQVIAAIIKELGITDYEPRVLPQLVEFAYRYVARVLEDAQLFSSYAQKKIIDSDDVSLALQMQLDRTFVGPPSRDVLLEISKNKNSQPLPPIKSHNGMRLPADRYSLVAPNFALVTDNKLATTNASASTNNITKPTIVRSVSSLLTGNTFMNSKPTTSSPGIGNKTTSQPLNSTLSNSNINNNNNDMMFGTKRRLEET